MKSVSLNMRRALAAQETEEVLVHLVRISHPDLPADVLLSSDPTERISTEPLIYGTRSNGDTYYAVLMEVMLPDDEEEAPPKTSLVFENVDYDVVSVLRSTITPADVTIKIVNSSTPNDVEIEYSGFKAEGSRYSADRVTLDITRLPLNVESFPYYRMTKAAFPGLFK